MAIEMAKNNEADIIIGTDPDCDRVGVVVRGSDGRYIFLTGNQTGALLVDYVLGALQRQGRLPADGAVIKTIVTSEIGREIAKSYGIEAVDTYTGFKFICEKVQEFEDEGDKTFLFGYEESFGYLAGDFVRDKDAVIASMLICEMAAYYKSRGMNLYDGLVELWQKFGYYHDAQESVYLEGREGMARIKEIMEDFRHNPRYGSVDRYSNHSGLQRTESILSRKDRIDPINMSVPSDVLRYRLEDGPGLQSGRRVPSQR